MKIDLACDLPNECYLACSGGIDSMVALDFILNGGRKPKIIHFNHQTEHGHNAEQFIRQRCKELSLNLTVEKLLAPKDPNLSEEEFWRNERYSVFNKLSLPVITAHHLDDAVEWWIFSSLHSSVPRLIPVTNKNVIRPFLLTKKEVIKDWAARKNVKWIEDISNESRKHMRNIIRHDIIPHALKINPGLHKVVAKQYRNMLMY